MKLKLLYTLSATLFFMSTAAFPQSQRGLINDGVELYDNEKYSDAEVNFKKGLEKDFETFEGHFNLGDALYKQGRFDEAIDAYKNALVLSDDDYRKSKAYYNIGNSLLKSQKLKESIEAYKNSLKLDPDDLEAKYNLSYALNMLKQQQNQQQQQQNQDKNKDQNKDQQQDQQNQDQQNQDQQNQDQQNQDQQQQQNDEQNKNQQQQQQQQKKDEISKEEAKRILDALKNNEAELQKKLRERKAKVTKKEKDW